MDACFSAPLSAPLPQTNWNWLAALADQGWAVVHGLVPKDLTRALFTEAQAEHEDDRLERAGIGRVDDHTIDTGVRRDKTRWMDRSTDAQTRYLSLMEDLRLVVNRELYLGLFSYEAHFAVYEPGGFYLRHVDAFRGSRNRVLSTVFYLNEDWSSQDGGELAIYAADADPGDAPLSTILPDAGTMVVFLSEDIPHEVLAAKRDRYSIAGWFRVNDRMLAPSLQAVSPIGGTGL